MNTINATMNTFTDEFFDFLVNDTTEDINDAMELDLALEEAFAADLVETNDDELDLELEKALEAAINVVEPAPVVDMELLKQIAVPAARMRDPSDPCAHMFEKKPKVVDEGEVVKTDRRNENHKAPARVLLSTADRKRYSASMYVDKMVVPTVELYGEERLTTSKISEELERDFRGLSTIVVTRATLASAVSFGFYEAFRTKFPAGTSDAERIACANNLVGHIIPIFGQTRAPPATGLGAKSKISMNHAPLCDGHTFGYEPVIIATKGDGAGDSGEIVCQGVIVSNKGLNYEVGNLKRVTLGRRDEFEETLCYVLITHYYGAISYDALGPFPTTRVGKDSYRYIETEGKNKYNEIFRWNEFMSNHQDQLGCGVSRFGFTDTKQTGKDLSRRLFPWSIRYAMDTLEWLRGKDMDNVLAETPMSTGRRAKEREDMPSGSDIRRFLLAEFLLKGTPLEKMITNEPVVFPFEAPIVRDGGEGLYSRLLEFNNL
ncbi:hypothetical protein ATCVMN08101_480R [Acanthocystis turfacea Chlorella virus MN0810.1]|nr:hypothetical protein ATCVMN08101_480R [Acanthocystis turfacea Chlorella virus MN0810.1]